MGVAEGDALFESAETAMPEGNGQASSMLPGFYELRRRADFADRQVEHENYEPEEFAVSYDGLLRKLTAAEVFAAERSMTDEEANSPLLPLLKSLRHDLERLRAVVYCGATVRPRNLKGARAGFSGDYSSLLEYFS